MTARQLVSMSLAGALAAGAFAACGDDEPGTAPTFVPSLAADRLVSDLSSAEADAFCSDASRFFAQPSSRADICRVNGFYQALFAAIDPGASDAVLRRACEFDECDDANTADLSTSFGSCGPPPANCRATVGETAACVNDTLARYHLLASGVPDCGSLTRASLEAMDLGSVAMAQFSDAPAACVAYETKCGGTSNEVVAFAEEFCGLLEPCCVREGLGTRCVLKVQEQERDYAFDPIEAARCLAKLRERQSRTDFCETVGDDAGFGSWYLIAECDSVFAYVMDAAGGTDPFPTHDKLPGEPCTRQSECAVGVAGNVRCIPVPLAGAALAEPICVQTTLTAGDACVGTYDSRIPGGASLDSNAGMFGFLCDHDRDLHCDGATRQCVATVADGAPCTTTDTCSAQSFCDTGGNCTARRAIGAACNANVSLECAGNGYCDAQTSTCRLPGEGGAPCTDGDFIANQNVCESGFCEDGACVSSLRDLCWLREEDYVPPRGL